MSVISWVKDRLGINHPPPTFIPYSNDPSGLGPVPPSSTMPNSQLEYNYSFTDPNAPPPSQQGGNWIWDAAKGVWGFLKDNAGDVLQTGASAIDAYMSSEDRAKALAEQARQFNESLKQRQAESAQSAGQFDRTTGNTEAQLAAMAQAALNKAPLADKAQALLLSRMGVAPSTFQPRDYTKGTSDLLRNTPPPSAHVTQTMQNAAANYRPGNGGVNTATTQWLLNRMRTSADPAYTQPTSAVPQRPAPVRTNPEENPMQLATDRPPGYVPSGILRRRMGLPA